MGWWVGKWESKNLYEGDKLDIKPDGSFASAGKKNIADGSVWINMVNGDINLK